MDWLALERRELIRERERGLERKLAREFRRQPDLLVLALLALLVLGLIRLILGVDLILQRERERIQHLVLGWTVGLELLEQEQRLRLIMNPERAMDQALIVDRLIRGKFFFGRISILLHN